MEVAIIPRFFIRKISSDFQLQNDYNILISNVIIILIFWLLGGSLLSILNYIPHFCLIDKLIGVGCPVCGTTRAFCEVFSGKLTNAYTYNKASIWVALFFVIQIPLRLLSIFKIIKTIKVNKISKYISQFILLLIVVNWIVKLFINY